MEEREGKKVGDSLYRNHPSSSAVLTSSQSDGYWRRLRQKVDNDDDGKDNDEEFDNDCEPRKRLSVFDTLSEVDADDDKEGYASGRVAKTVQLVKMRLIQKTDR